MTSAIARFVAGARLPLRAAALLRDEPAVRRAALVPLAVSVSAVALAVAGVVAWAGPLHELAAGWLPWPEAGAWWAWLWIGPARLLLAALGWILFLALAAAAVGAAFLAGALVGSPFHERLSRLAEAAATGGVRDATPDAGWVRSAVSAVGDEARRLAIFLAAQAVLLVGGVLVPGAAPLAAGAGAVLTALFLVVDTASWALERRGLRFREQLAWSRGRPARVAGLAAAALALSAIPLANLFVLPVLVVAATLLVLDEEAERGGGGRRAGRPSAGG